MNSWIRESIFYHIYPLGFCGVLEQDKIYKPGNRLSKIISWIPHLLRTIIKLIRD